MAVDLHGRDHSPLPSQLFDEDYDVSLSLNKPISTNTWSCFGSSDSGSLLSSPVESELGSTETESDPDEDYMAELSRQMAHYMLQEDDKQEKVTLFIDKVSVVGGFVSGPNFWFIVISSHGFWMVRRNQHSGHHYARTTRALKAHQR